MLEEGRLQRVQCVVGRQPLGRIDAAPLDLQRQRAARVHEASIDQDAAGAAIGGFADALHGAEPFSPQDVEERVMHANLKLMRAIVQHHVQGHALVAHGAPPDSTPTQYKGPSS